MSSKNSQIFTCMICNENSPIPFNFICHDCGANFCDSCTIIQYNGHFCDKCENFFCKKCTGQEANDDYCVNCGLNP